jgi:hypothetical protein
MLEQDVMIVDDKLDPKRPRKSWIRTLQDTDKTDNKNS